MGDTEHLAAKLKAFMQDMDTRQKALEGRLTELSNSFLGKGKGSNNIGSLGSLGLENLKQKGSVEEYESQFQQLLARSSGVTTQQQVHLFMAGLKEEIRADLELQQPGNLRIAYSSRSGSTSRSSVLYSSSSLMSDSKSNQQKSGSAKSRSIPHKSLSLSPPNKTEVKLDGSLDISSSMQTKPVVTHERQRLEVLAEDSIGCGNTGVDVHSNLVIMQVSQQLEVVSKEENVASESTLMVVQDENMIVCVDGQDDFKIDNPQTNDDQSRGSLDNKNGLVRNPSRDLRDESELQTLGGELHVPNKSGSKITSSTRASYTSISLGELDIVMKHYNLKDTGENGGQLSLEEFFSCARMWPWEIIYYRKLKKGPISTENYARRLAQNEEFGITDKYVRSSSGWGEPTE